MKTMMDTDKGHNLSNSPQPRKSLLLLAQRFRIICVHHVFIRGNSSSIARPLPHGESGAAKEYCHR